MHEAVKNAISVMQTRYDEQITLEELAAGVFFSPFHFCRLFRRYTGMPPGHYLTAVRLFEAKRLLMTTSRTVADIVTTVGYSSVGTFTTRFTRATGMPPTQFRDSQADGLFAAVGPGFLRLPLADAVRAAKSNKPPILQPTGSILSSLGVPHDVVPANVLIGVFDSLVPQAEPVACQVVTGASSSEVVIHEVPPGTWYVIAIGTPVGATQSGPVVIGTSRPAVSVAVGRTAAADVQMRRPIPTDPPLAVMVASTRCRQLADRS